MTDHLTRRGALRTIVSLGVGAAAIACGESDEGDGTIDVPLSCVLTPEQFEGPFFFDTGLLRRDITEGRPGVPLRLQVRLASVAGTFCSPIPGAVVEAWHGDADGVYSGYTVDDGNLRDTIGETFLRGYQVSDDRGLVEFSTIYPGWYPGRTIHIHLIIRLDSTRRVTTQLYFPESVNDAAMSQAPYSARGLRDTTNDKDFVLVLLPGDLLCEISRSGDGYLARFSLGVAA